MMRYIKQRKMVEIRLFVMRKNNKNVMIIVFTLFFVFIYGVLISINYSFYKKEIIDKEVNDLQTLISHSEQLLNKVGFNVLDKKQKDKNYLHKILAREANVNINSIAIIYSGKYIYSTLVGDEDRAFITPVNLGLNAKEKSNLSGRPVISFVAEVGNKTLLQVFFKKHDLTMVNKLGRAFYQIGDVKIGHDNKLIKLVNDDKVYVAKCDKYGFSLVIEYDRKTAFINFVKDSVFLLSFIFFLLFFIFFMLIKYNNIDYYVLKKALSKNEICPFIQPIVDQNKNVIGGEVLARWIKKNGEIISPLSFISRLEKYSLIPSLTVNLLTQVFNSDLVKKSNDLILSFNLTEKCLHDEKVQQQCIKLSSRCQLILEFTESSEFENVQLTLETMQKLRAYGIQFALDDYGTGYSSLQYLNLYDFDSLKIDKSFVDTIESSELTLHIIESIVLLATKLNIKLIAEGVENIEQKETLQRLGVHKYQGFLFYKPESLDSFSMRI